MGRLNFRLDVERDIERCRDVLENYSNDKKKLSSAFYEIMPKYIKVEGFSKDLQVVDDYASPKDCIQIYKSNITLIRNRLEDFLANKCEGLSKASVKNPEKIEESFEEAKLQINNLVSVSDSAKADILKKLDEIKDICLSEISRTEKWDSLRPYVMWISGKDIDTAQIFLPLILKIN